MVQQTITAFYESREYANNAALMLRQAGIPDTQVTVSPESAAADHAVGDRPTGFWASLEEMFGGSDEHSTYAEGLRRGGIIVVAHVDDEKVDDAVRILEQHGSVDLDEREATWRSEGWTGGTTITGGGAADDGVGPLRSIAPAVDTKSTATSGAATLASTETRSAARPTGTDDVLQVVEESLNVGKRAVTRGKVRIHSYVVETPVTETVNLRDETVTVDRRPVDRPLGAAELGIDAFKDRTIEVEEVKEEAVVAKSARVVEEIGIRKEVRDRAETISDTVRSTKVDVEDARTTGVKTAFAAGSSTGSIEAEMEVVGSDGVHVGVIDHVDGASIKLKKNDPASGGQHHLLSTDWVKSVDRQVVLTITAADALKRWTAA